MPLTRIPFGVDLPRHAKPPRRDPRKLVIGFIGQIMPHKGPDLLIGAAQRTLAPSRYELRIYGDDSQDRGFAASLRDRAHGNPVQFLGVFPSDRMRDVLDEIDVLAIPSRWYENSPLVLLNALASHTPVVISDVPGMSEFVEEGVGGYAFRRGDEQALADVLGRLDRDPGALPRVLEGAHYDVTSLEMAKRTVGVYAATLGVGARPMAKAQLADAP